MKSFWHYNEYDVEARCMLAPLLIFSEQATLWSPSGQLIREAYDKGESGIDPNGFLELLERGLVRVAARTDWLIDGDTRRSSTFPHATFDREFDGRILRMFEDDLGSTAPRVLGLREEAGYDYADIEISKRSEASEKAKGYVKRGFVPPGTMERIRKNFGKEPMSAEQLEVMATRMFLRNAKNHEDAKNAVGAEISVDSDLSIAVALADTAGRKPDNSNFERNSWNSERFRYAMEFASRVGRKETAKGMIEILEDRKERQFIIEIMNSQLSFSDALRLQIEGNRDEKSFSEEILGTKIGEKAAALAGLASTTVTVGSAIAAAHSRGLNRRVFLAMTVGSLAGTVGFAGEVQNVLERSSLLGEADYAGPKWYFMLKCGTTSPIRNQIDSWSDAILGR